MNFLDRAIAAVAPRIGADRARARLSIMHYDAATVGRRGASWRSRGTDADAAGSKRERMSFVSRDMVRNNPFALSGQQVIVNNTVGDGIIPKITCPEDVVGSEDLRKRGLKLIEDFIDTTCIDALGRQNLYGLQRLAMNSIVDAGEVLILREFKNAPRGKKTFNLRLRVLEPDYLDDLQDRAFADGGYIRNGIEYDKTGQRTAYHLYDEHPGAEWFRGVGWNSKSRRVPAADVLHIFRQDRPGQQRGVTWFAPITLALQDLGEYQDAQQMRQKVAACFSAFHRRSTARGEGETQLEGLGGTLSPGLIQEIASDEEITFANPPDVGGYDQVMRQGLLSIAAGLGITYEEFVGDLLNVNFSSGRMGRMKMDRNVSSWQWLMLIPQMMNPIGTWIKEEWALCDAEHMHQIMACSFNWVPPHRMLVDPAREIPALNAAVRAGFESRQGVVRKLGHDPERLLEEQSEDAKNAAAAGLMFDSDAAAVSSAGVVQPNTPEDEAETKDSKNGE
jgi:lambda family phage portal protein